MVKAKHDLNRHGVRWPIYIDVQRDKRLGNLMIYLYTDIEGEMELLSALTAKADRYLPEDQAYVNVDANGVVILDWIKDNELGELIWFDSTGEFPHPLYRFYLEKLK